MCDLKRDSLAWGEGRGGGSREGDRMKERRGERGALAYSCRRWCVLHGPSKEIDVLGLCLLWLQRLLLGWRLLGGGRRRLRERRKEVIFGFSRLQARTRR